MADENKPIRTEKVLVSAVLAFEPINPEDGTGARPRDLEFSLIETTTKKNGEVDKTGWTWQAATNVVIDGEEVPETARNKSPRKAAETLIGKLPPSSATIDNYVEPSFETEFFKTKPEPSKAKAAMTYDKKATVNGAEHSLAEWRGELEASLQSANDNETSAQADIMKAASVLVELHETVFKSNIKDTTSFVRGDGAGDNATNMPLLKTLGSGSNAVREFMCMGQLSERLRAVLPVTTTSGKGLDRYRSEALKGMLTGAKGDTSGPVYRFIAESDNPLPNWVGTGDKAEPAFDVLTAAELLRTIATDQRYFNIARVDEMTLDEIANEMDRISAEKAASFLAEGGKHFNMYNDKMYKAAIKTFGMVLISNGGKQDDDPCVLSGAGAFRTAVKRVVALDDAIESKNDSAITKAMEDLHSIRKNPLHGYAVGIIRAALRDKTAEQKRTEVLDDVGDDDKVITKTARKSFASLETVAAAARIFNLLQARHGKGTKDDVNAVLREVRAMVDSLPEPVKTENKG